MIAFTVPGEPKGKGRPRLGRSGHAYTPHDTAVYENLVKVCFKESHPMHVPLEDGVAVDITAYYGIPKSTSKKRRFGMLMRLIRPLRKPDLDNVAKIICDSLNGIAYHDDSQVYDLHVRKYYDDQPRVDVRIEWSEDGAERQD